MSQRATPQPPRQPTPASQPIAALHSADDVRAVVESWRSAWEGKDLERYMSFYDESFHSEGRDRAGWRQHKRGVFLRAGDLQVAVEALEIEMTGDKASARFLQRYSSGKYRDRGTKTLRMVFRPAGPRIVAEEFEPGS